MEECFKTRINIHKPATLPQILDLVSQPTVSKEQCLFSHHQHRAPGEGRLQSFVIITLKKQGFPWEGRCKLGMSEHGVHIALFALCIFKLSTFSNYKGIFNIMKGGKTPRVSLFEVFAPFKSFALFNHPFPQTHPRTVHLWGVSYIHRRKTSLSALKLNCTEHFKTSFKHITFYSLD